MGDTTWACQTQNMRSNIVQEYVRQMYYLVLVLTLLAHVWGTQIKLTNNSVQVAFAQTVAFLLYHPAN